MKKEDVLLYIDLVLCLIWMFCMIYYNFKHPITIDSLTVEERIRYEQMIFP